MADFFLVKCLIAILVMCATTYLVWRSFETERAFHREFQSRDPMSDELFCETYYAVAHIPEDIPRRLRPVYARQLDLDPLKIRPEDRPPEIDDLDLIELIQDIERTFRVTISDADLEHIDGSFDSIVQYLATARSPRQHMSDEPPAGDG